VARTLLDLAKSCERRAAAVSTSGNEAKKRKGLAILTYLAHVTPVDTSKALSNWQFGIGEKPSARRGAFFVGSEGSTAQISTETTINFGKAQLESIKPGEPLYISNLLPYIRRLNDGWSAQHPGGFVEAAALLARTTP
jgi:hypothetical protein